jgi:hypothetical protein
LPDRGLPVHKLAHETVVDRSFATTSVLSVMA